jgi:acyl-CoA thioester hydrolase
MPRIHERTFRVRHVECDANGMLYPANTLRYMQEAAMDASTAAGYSVAWYDKHGHMWLIRATDLWLLHPVRSDEHVIIKTWVADFRRVRSRRAYEIRHAQSGQIVARAYTDWVYLDTATLRPVTVPDDMLQGFWPDGPPAEELPPREPFPDDPPPEDAFTQVHEVRWRDLDQAGHVNNAMYLDFMENCGAADSTRGDLTPLVDGRATYVPRRFRLDYRLPALLGETLHVVTWGVDSGARRYVVQRASDGERLVGGVVTHVGPG